MTDQRASPALMALQLSCRGSPTRERLLKDWLSFYEARGELALLRALPASLQGGTPIDWLRVYEEVVTRGGYREVSRRALWPALLQKDCLNISNVRSYVLAAHYERFLLAFEEKQLFGRDLPVAPIATKSTTTGTSQPRISGQEPELIATASELQDAQSARATPLPPPSKKLKMQRAHELANELGGNSSLHTLVLALDSELPREVVRALNLLTVLSFGSGHEPAQAHHASMDLDQELLVDSAPGLLDALYRQLRHCAPLLQTSSLLQPAVSQTPGTSACRRLLNVAPPSASPCSRAPLATHALLVLNILRNASMVPANAHALADHDDLVLWCILALRELHGGGAQWRLGDHALDILCAIGTRIDFLALHPTSAQLQLRQTPVARLWQRERVLPLECLLRSLSALITSRDAPRAVVLRACELLCHVTRDVAVRPLLRASEALHSDALVDRVVGLLAATRLDFMGKRHRSPHGHGRTQRTSRRLGHGHHGDAPMHGHGEEDDDDEDEDEDDASDDASDAHGDDPNTKWPAPWETDGLPSGIGMGVVYAAPDGGGSGTATGGGVTASSAEEDDRAPLDHEMRDAALEVLHRLSDGDEATRLRLARHPYCLPRLAGVLTSCIGRPEAARITVGILCNLSMQRDTFAHFLSIEKELLLLTCSDRSVADILANIVADVYGMHAL